MYQLYLRTSRLLLAVILLLPFQGQAQRTYTNSQANGVTGLCLLCSVQDPDNSVNNTNLDDFSAFSITAGLLGVSVHQTLIFPSVSTSGCDSLVIGIGSGNTVLSAEFFGGVTIETFNGGVSNNDNRVVSTAPLRLLANNTRAEVLFHPSASFDRVKITVSSNLLGLLNSFRVYYAFRSSGVPANPVYTVPETFACGDVWLPITNHTAGYDYNVRIIYRDGLNGNTIKDTFYTVLDNDTVFVRDLIAYGPAQAGVYVQAVNPFTGCTSDSVFRSIGFGGNATLPAVDNDSITICLGDSAILHAFIPISSFPFIRWYNAPTGGTLLHTGNYFKVSPAQTTTYYAAAGFACEYPERVPVTVFVTKLPDPDYTFPVEAVCTDAILAVLNHQEGQNYRVYVRFVPETTAPFDTAFTVINNDTIIIKNPRSPTFAYTTVHVQAVDPLTNCVSDTVSKVFQFGAASRQPTVDADSVAICSGDSVTLHGYVPTTSVPQIRWYDAPSGGTLLHTGPFFRVSPGTTTTFYVTAAFFCEYPDRVPVKVEVLSCMARLAGGLMSATSKNEEVPGFRLFPNPSRGEVRIQSTAWGSAQLQVFDITGRLLRSELLRQKTFRLEGVPGIYIVRIQTDNGDVWTSRINLQP